MLVSRFWRSESKKPVVIITVKHHVYVCWHASIFVVLNLISYTFYFKTQEHSYTSAYAYTRTHTQSVINISIWSEYNVAFSYLYFWLRMKITFAVSGRKRVRNNEKRYQKGKFSSEKWPFVHHLKSKEMDTRHAKDTLTKKAILTLD